MSKVMFVMGCGLASACAAAILGTHDVNSDGCIDLRDYSEFQKEINGPCGNKPQVIWKTLIDRGGVKSIANPRISNSDTFYVTDIWTSASVHTDVLVPVELRASRDAPSRSLVRVQPGMTRLSRPIPVRTAIEVTAPLNRGESFDLLLFGYYDTSPEIVEIGS